MRCATKKRKLVTLRVRMRAMFACPPSENPECVREWKNWFPRDVRSATKFPSVSDFLPPYTSCLFLIYNSLFLAAFALFITRIYHAITWLRDPC